LTEGSGETGDLSIYSFRKILPLPDGGGLRVNMGGQKAIAPNYYPAIISNFLSLLIILKSLLNVRANIFSRAELSSRKNSLFPHGAIDGKINRILPMSFFARNGMGNMSFYEIKERRRSDYQQWLHFTKSINVMSVFHDLPPGVCPLGFPVMVKDRDLLKSRMQEEGIFLKVHWHLPNSVGESFDRSHKLSRQMITLPVYPELSRKEREVIQSVLTS
jgi:hypothetical protein